MTEHVTQLIKNALNKINKIESIKINDFWICV